MPSAREVRNLRAMTAAVAAGADRALTAAWGALDLSRPDESRDLLLDAVPAITTAYGDAGSAVAADWYDAVRADEGVSGLWLATPAAPFTAEWVRDRVRFGARWLYSPTPEQMLPFLRGAVDEYTKQPMRDTVTQSASQDPKAAGWTRVTVGTTCKFCVMLAGRGGVYRSEHSAAFASHGHCDCTAVPSWDQNAEPVPARAYVASRRVGAMSAEQRAIHRERVRGYLDQMTTPTGG